jgi:hypothetical protein
MSQRPRSTGATTVACRCSDAELSELKAAYQTYQSGVQQMVAIVCACRR